MFSMGHIVCLCEKYASARAQRIPPLGRKEGKKRKKNDVCYVDSHDDELKFSTVRNSRVRYRRWCPGARAANSRVCLTRVRFHDFYTYTYDCHYNNTWALRIIEYALYVVTYCSSCACRTRIRQPLISSRAGVPKRK